MEEQAGYERRDNRHVKTFLLFLFVSKSRPCRSVGWKIQNQKGIVMEQTKLFEVQGETLILHLPEELDHHVAGQIREQTDVYFTEKRIRDVIFDYQNTNFMDSSGIGLVMGRYREVRYLKGDVYIVGVHDKIARILEISGLYRVAKRRNDVEDAMQDIEKKYGNDSEKKR